VSVRAVAVGVAGVLGAAAALFTILDSHSAGDVWRALWPGWIVALLVLVVVVLLAVPRIAASPDKLEADRKRWREIQRMLSRDSITWVREHNFATPWPYRRMEGFAEFERYDEVEHRFLDRGLERKRRALHDAVKELNNQFAGESFPYERGQWPEPMQGIGTEDLRDFGGDPQERTRVSRMREDLLMRAGQTVAQRYDDLYALARRKFKT
jgi:hypothetical protein